MKPSADSRAQGEQESPDYSSRVLRLMPAVVLLLGVFIAIRNRDVLNTDAIAYLRLAGYWADGNTALAVSGYWGPLLPWLLALPLKLGVEPLLAGHLLMAASAVLFCLGAQSLFARLGFSGWMPVCAVFAVAASALGWSAEYISPDLLLGGLVLLAVSVTIGIAGRGSKKAGPAIGAGILWGLAYHTKAIAFPLALVLIPGIHLLQWLSPAGGGNVTDGGRGDFRHQLKSFVIAMGCFLLISSPWITVLSSKYGHLTFSTTGKIAHAIVGPNDRDRSHPFGRMIHTPEPGRVTSWEDPSLMPYAFWSPFASPANRNHQIQLVKQNAVTVLKLLAGLDLGGFGLVSTAAALALLIFYGLRSGPSAWPWPLTAVLLVLFFLAAAYLPTYIRVFDQRYLYLALPLLLAVGMSWGELLKNTGLAQQQRLISGVQAVLVGSFLLSGTGRMLLAMQGLPDGPVTLAREIAHRMERARLNGPIAGSAFIGGQRVGLFTAFFLAKPWMGDEPKAVPDTFWLDAAPRVAVVRGSPLAGALAADGRYASLDTVLFENLAQAQEFPVQIFGRRGTVP